MNDLVSAQALIAAGADVEELDLRPAIAGRSGRRPLNWAAQMDHAEMVALLLDAGADPRLTNNSGFTPLHHAAETSSAAAARLLIERGADLEAVNKGGQTPLQIALRSPDGEVAALIQAALEDGGENADVVDPSVYVAPVALDDGLAVTSLAASGANQEKIFSLLSNLAAGAYEDVDSLLILKGGEVVVEQYYGSWSRDRPHPMQSVSKGITALLVGSALRQGHIESLSDPIAKYLPNHSELLTEGRSQITLENLLTMSAGFDWNEQEPAYGQPGNIRFEEVMSKDAVAFTLERPHKNPPGTVFTYSGGYVTVVGEILVNATGAESVLDYLSRSTLMELGLDGHKWLTQADGRQNTAGGVMLRPRDLAKIGQLMLDGGTWKGKRLLDETFVRDTLAPRIQPPGDWNEYGYYWWGRTLETDSGSYELDAALGWGGQELILVPALDLVVVMTATNYRFPTPTISILTNYILPAFETSP
jgi:CubicO group peptidase (beta-lactamase class C family)